jgi:hypothetical protein
LETLAPHLKRAAEIHQLLSRARMATDSLAAAVAAAGFAVFLLAKDCRVVFANAKAEDLVRGAIDVDFSARTYSFSVDGKPLEGGPFPFDAEVNTNVLKRGSLLVFTAPDTTQLKKSNYVVHDDNFSIATLGTSQTSQVRPK